MLAVLTRVSGFDFAEMGVLVWFFDRDFEVQPCERGRFRVMEGFSRFRNPELGFFKTRDFLRKLWVLGISRDVAVLMMHGCCPNS